MNEREKPTEPEKVPCEVCLKEIPPSEANTAEVSDYVVYFCGLDCYEKWREKNKKKE